MPIWAQIRDQLVTFSDSFTFTIINDFFNFWWYLFNNLLYLSIKCKNRFTCADVRITLNLIKTLRQYNFLYLFRKKDFWDCLITQYVFKILVGFLLFSPLLFSYSTMNVLWKIYRFQCMHPTWVTRHLILIIM